MSKLARDGGNKTIGEGTYRAWPEVGDEERAAVASVLERGVLSGLYAPATRRFEEAFAEAQGVKHALLTHCGTSALQLAVGALGVGEGDEVIVPAYSFIATAFAVMQEGAIPIFADVDDQGLVTAEAIEPLLSARTRAIMPVHVHGMPVELDALLALTKKHGLHLIEDAAQAHLATFRGQKVGGLGAAGGFSMQSSKNLSAGEGGVFTTNDDGVAEQANRIRNFGHDLVAADRAHWDPTHPLDGHRAADSLRVGSMYRGNELMAAFAGAALEKLPRRTARAREHAAWLGARLAELPGVRPPSAFAHKESAHHKYRVSYDPEVALGEAPRDATRARALELAFRRELLGALRAEGAEVVLWQDAPLPHQTVFQRLMGFAQRGDGPGSPWSALPHDELARVRDNYRVGGYPRTEALLARSVVLFSQSYPLIAQERPAVEKTFEAFAKVWERRDDLAARARASAA